MPRHAPVNALESPRLNGIRNFSWLPHTRNLDGVDVAVFGIPIDTAKTYRTGARFGPGAVREMSAMLRTDNPSLDVNDYDHQSVIDYGDLPTVPGYFRDTHARVVAALEPLLAAGDVPIGVGGGHSVPLAELRAMAAHDPAGITALTGANVVFEFLSVLALNRRARLD